MKVARALLGVLLLVLPLLSIAAWAAFDYRWWVPDEGGGRMMVLVYMHFIVSFGGGYLLWGPK